MTKKNKSPACSSGEHPLVKASIEKQRFKLRKATPCKHLHMIPYILRAERKTYAGNVLITDKECSMINGQYLIVEKYYCPECKTFIEPPKE